MRPLVWQRLSLAVSRATARHILLWKLIPTLGTHGLDIRMRQEAAIHYGKAIHRLSHNLQDPMLRQDPANIVAALLLSLYEVRAPQNPKTMAHRLKMGVCKNRVGWIQHAGGVGRLLELRGASSHREKLAKK